MSSPVLEPNNIKEMSFPQKVMSHQNKLPTQTMVTNPIAIKSKAARFMGEQKCLKKLRYPEFFFSFFCSVSSKASKIVYSASIGHGFIALLFALFFSKKCTLTWIRPKHNIWKIFHYVEYSSSGVCPCKTSETKDHKTTIGVGARTISGFYPFSTAWKTQPSLRFHRSIPLSGRWLSDWILSKFEV